MSGETRETQASVYQWMQDTFPGADKRSPRKAIRLFEEAIELCLVCGASPDQLRAAFEKEVKGLPGEIGHRRPLKIEAEAADVQIVLFGVAGLNEFDLSEAVHSKMIVNRNRQWKANGDGTGYHIKADGSSKG